MRRWAAAAIAHSQAQAFWKLREATAQLPAQMHPPINFDVGLPMVAIGRSIGGELAEIERIVYERVAEFGGSVPAEHGIGLHKRAWLGASRTPAELAVMRAVSCCWASGKSSARRCSSSPTTSTGRCSWAAASS